MQAPDSSARSPQGLTEAGHQVVEVAVGHHQDHVARAQGYEQALQQRIGVGEIEGFPASGRNAPSLPPAAVGDRV